MKFISCLLLLVVVSGCKSMSPYLSPRVEGRVVDAQTWQPIKGVQVRRISNDQEMNGNDAPKGGELMQAKPPVVTGADGTFVLKSLRDFALLGKIKWYSVSILFKRSGYKPFTATYTLTDATNAPSGEPQVRAGDIVLIPLSK